jgi:hypothetical protein
MFSIEGYGSSSSGSKELNPKRKKPNLIIDLTEQGSKSQSTDHGDRNFPAIKTVFENNVNPDLPPSSVHGGKEVIIVTPRLIPSFSSSTGVEPKDKEWLQEVKKSFFSGTISGIGEFAKKGISGSYVLLNENEEPIAILKPLDEEAGAHNGFQRDRAKMGIVPGTSGYREVLAHQLYKEQVPATLLAEIVSHDFNSSYANPNKTVSVQKWEPDTITLYKLEKGKRGSLKPFLHSVASMDLCLHNSDRNRSNLLIKQDQDSKDVIASVPIDHGCVLPENCDSGARFCWYTELKDDDTFSSEEQEAIEGINLAEYQKKCTDIGLSEGVLNTLDVSIYLAKRLKEKPIREIADYYIDKPAEDLLESHQNSLTHSILRMAAVLEGKNIHDFGRISTEKIYQVVQEVTSFIESEKSSEVHAITRTVLSRLVNEENRDSLVSGLWQEEIRIILSQKFT